MGAADAPTNDPLFTLREYRKLAPWRLRDLATVIGAVLEASGIRPVNAAAALRPNERTIRFYVARTLVAPPEGRGTAAIYSYRHLLQVLFIKLRQMEGATLEKIHEELQSTTGDVLERRVASSVGAALPSPGQLPFLTNDEQPRGRAGQLFQVRLSEPATESAVTTHWHRLEVGNGIELHVRDDHPLAHVALPDRTIADAIRLVAQRLIASTTTPTDASGQSRQRGTIR
ncbi:MAG: MerR family transcriptional regulator [Gemmatimonadales bacterium]